jgi:hypothetical protein
LNISATTSRSATMTHRCQASTAGDSRDEGPVNTTGGAFGEPLAGFRAVFD